MYPWTEEEASATALGGFRALLPQSIMAGEKPWEALEGLRAHDHKSEPTHLLQSEIKSAGAHCTLERPLYPRRRCLKVWSSLTLTCTRDAMAKRSGSIKGGTPLCRILRGSRRLGYQIGAKRDEGSLLQV